MLARFRDGDWSSFIGMFDYAAIVPELAREKYLHLRLRAFPRPGLQADGHDIAAFDYVGCSAKRRLPKQRKSLSYGTEELNF